MYDCANYAQLYTKLQITAVTNVYGFRFNIK